MRSFYVPQFLRSAFCGRFRFNSTNDVIVRTGLAPVKLLFSFTSNALNIPIVLLRKQSRFDGINLHVEVDLFKSGPL